MELVATERGRPGARPRVAQRHVPRATRASARSTSLKPTSSSCGDSMLEFAPSTPEQVDVPDVAEFGPLVGTSAGHARACSSACRRPPRPSSRSSSPGETGTGKELVAQAIHEASSRAQQAVRRRRLRRHPGDAGGERALRPRARLVHRRGRQARLPVRRGRRRHDLPRRARRAPHRRAAQAPARARRAAHQERRLERVPPGQRARHRRDAPRPRARGQRRDVPERPLLPRRAAQGRAARRSASASRTSPASCAG